MYAVSCDYPVEINYSPTTNNRPKTTIAIAVGHSLTLSSLLLMTLPPLALRFSLTSFEPNVGFGTFFSPKRLALSAFHDASVAARPPIIRRVGWILLHLLYCT
jgi:hypothetical protein